MIPVPIYIDGARVYVRSEAMRGRIQGRRVPAGFSAFGYRVMLDSGVCRFFLESDLEPESSQLPPVARLVCVDGVRVGP